MYEVLLQFLVPFIIASSVVVGVTIIAEKFGTRIGGIVGTIPSTIIVAFVFIAMDHGEEFASRSISVVPAEMAINLIFLFAFTLLAGRGPVKALVVSLFIWGFLSSVIYFVHFQSILFSYLIYSVTLLVLFILMERILKMRSKGSVSVKYTPMKILFRGTFAGVIIGLTVVLSNIGEVISGIFSVFPAIFLSTMLITLKEHGSRFSGGIGKSMVLGSQTVVIYSIAVHFLYPEVGIFLGTVVSFLISIIMLVVLLLIRDRFS
jgi:hypothetical protein